MMRRKAMVNVDETAERFRMPRLVLAFVGLILTLALLPVSGAAASSKTTPDVKVLFHRAVKLVRATPNFSQAVMLEAVGTPSGSADATSASDIDIWQFVFDNTSSGNVFLSAEVFYGPPPMEFGPVIGRLGLFFGDRQMPKAPAMTLKQAVKRLQDAGFVSPFLAVSLRNPLTQTISDTLYIFSFSSGAQVAVDTVTRQVFVIG